MLHLSHLPHHEPGERIILYLRRHWYILLRIVTLYCILGLFPVSVGWLIGKETPTLKATGLWEVVVPLFLSLYYFFWWVLLYRSFLDYYLDIWIVTDRRILSIEQYDLFHRVIAEHRLIKIQDVTSTQRGILPTFFDYGEVLIQTAGSKPQFSFDQIPHPHEVARQINTLIEWNRHHGQV